MKFLLDQDVYANTARVLIELGHDVVRVADIGLAKASDEMLLEIAHQRNRIMITRDRDYGNLVFVKGKSAGVLYLRIIPSTQNAIHDELERVLKLYAEDDIMNAFIVIEHSGHRMRRIPLK